MPKITFGIPVYKAESTLKKCVESIANGEEKDIEIILVNDGSPDSSLNICLELEKKYNFVYSFGADCALPPYLLIL